MIRWILLLQEFGVEIRDKKGVENVVADHLSRLENSEEGLKKENSIKEEFLDEYLFSDHITPWFADIANFLASDILLPNLNYQQKKKFFYDIKYYLWEDPFLYKVCANGMIRRCVLEEEYGPIFHHCHALMYYNQVFIGQPCSRMPIGMSLHVINVKR